MTHKTQPTAHAEITAPISADLRRIDDAGAKLAPITLMTEDRACKWAWDQVQQDVGTKGWTAGDSGTFFGFFLWGWNYRGQYETQRPAAPPAPAAVEVPAVAMTPSEIGEIASAWIRPGQSVALAAVRDIVEAVLHRLRGKIEIRESAIRAALAAAPAQDWPSECDSPELCQVHRGCAGQYGTKNTCPSFAALNPCNTAAPAQAVAVPITTPRFAAWTKLRDTGFWPDGVPDWARDATGRMHDMTAAKAVISELHEAVRSLATAPAQEHATQLAGQAQDETMQALSDLTNALRERHHGRMPEEVQRAYDKAWAIVFAGPLPAAPAQAQEDARDLEWLTKEGRAHGFRIGQTIEGAVITHSTESLRAAIDAARAAQGVPCEQ